MTTQFKTTYKGFWVPGETGFTGHKHILGLRTGKYIQKSKKLFSAFGRDWGFQLLVDPHNEYDPDALRFLDDNFCDLFTVVYDDYGDLVYDLPYKEFKPIVAAEGLTSLIGARVRGSDKSIGDPELALYLYNSGITEFDTTLEGSTVGVGFNPKKKKWYGWSHRALYGFGIGSTVKKGDVAYCPKTIEEWVESAVEFYEKPIVEEYDDEFVLRSEDSDISIPIAKDEFASGRGEWTAETLDDAHQMAIDFHESVS